MATRKQQIKGWVMFDWANSAYNLVIVSTVFPAIFKAFTPSEPTFLGIKFSNSDSLYTYAICFSYLIIVCTTPFLSGIADYGGYKKRYMQFFSTLGSSACVLLYWFDENNLWIGILGAVLASVGFSGSLVFYNGFLSQIVPKKFHDKVSAKGFAYGYFGSCLLLLFVIALDTFKTSLGFSEDDNTSVFRLGFILVGLWWFGWARWTFAVLPKDENKNIKQSLALKKGVQELKKVWSQIKELPRLKRFLSAFFVIDLGVQTIVIIAPLFAINVFKMTSSQLIVMVIIMQFVGIAGAALFSIISKHKGNVTALILATVSYIVVCILATFAQQQWMVYLIASLIGFSMGGIQSILRSTYSKLLPPTNDHASFFSFFDITEKIAIVIGTFIYAGVEIIATNLHINFAERLGVGVLGLFFIAGVILLARLKRFKSLEPTLE